MAVTRSTFFTSEFLAQLERLSLLSRLLPAAVTRSSFAINSTQSVSRLDAPRESSTS